MTRRIITQGRDSWSHRQGYVHRSNQNARFVRPDGELGIIEGALLIAGVLGVVTLLIVGLS